MGNEVWERPHGRREFLTAAALAVPAVGGMAALAGCGGGSSTGSTGGGGGGSGSGTVHVLSAEAGPEFIGAPIYIADAVGYFKQEGVKVSVDYPGSSPRCTQLLLAGQGDVALVEPASLIAAKGRKEDTRMMWSYGNGSFFAFGVAEDSPITAFEKKQIDGTKIGISELAGGEVPILRGALAQIGLSDDDVELVAVGGGTPEAVSALEDGGIDLLAGSLPDFTSVEARGVKIRFITPQEITEFPRNGFAVTDDYLESNRDALEGFLRAITKAMVFMTADYTAAAKIVKSAASESLGDLSIQEVADTMLEQLLGSGLTQYFEKGSDVYHQIGHESVEDWEKYMEFLVQGAVETAPGVSVQKEVPVDEIVDNSLIEPANDFNYARVEKQAKGYRGA